MYSDESARKKNLNWPCLSAAPPSYTEDTTNFPKGESAPPSRARSSCPIWKTTNSRDHQSFSTYSFTVVSKIPLHKKLSQYLFDSQQPHISPGYLVRGELWTKGRRVKGTKGAESLQQQNCNIWSGSYLWTTDPMSRGCGATDCKNAAII